MKDEKFFDRLDHFAGIALKGFIDADKKLIVNKHLYAAEDIEMRCQIWSDCAYMVATKMVASREWAIDAISWLENNKNEGGAA